jgi:fibronectin-binding autotransporter adhesin
MPIEIDNDNNEIRIDGYEYATTKVAVKSYGISSESSQTGNSADLRLTDSDGYTDNVTFVGGTNVTIIRTNENTITFSTADIDTNTKYSVSAETSQTGNSADLRLTDTDGYTDNVTFTGGSNVTIVRTDANKITISASANDTNTTYGISAETNATPKSADLRLTGSDASTDNVTFVGGTNVNVVRTDQNTLTINSSQPAFGTMSDGNVSAVADQANDTFTFVAGTGIGVLVNGPADSMTISNTGVTQAVAGTGISVSAGTGSVTIGNTGVTAITAGTAITTSGSGNVTVNNDGVTTFNGAKGAITYNSFGTMSDGTNTAAADLANDTFTFVPGTGIGVLVSSASDNITISNTGVTSLNGGTGATYTYSTFTDGATPTTASLGNTTMTLSGTNGVKVTTSPNTATISMTETSKILAGTTTIPIAPSGPNTFFNIANMPVNSAVEIRGVILLKFSGAGANNTINFTLATSGTFTHAGVDLQLGVQNAEITSSVPGFTTAALNDSNVHALWFSGVIVNGGTTATPSININNNSGVNTLDILAKSFIKFNYI